MKTLRKNAKELFLAIVIVAVIIIGFVLGQKAKAAIVYDAPSCQLSTQAGDIVVDFGGQYLLSNGIPNYPPIVKNTNIPAGSYDIFLQSFDGYDTRIDVSQPHEQYLVSFNSASGEIARTNPTADLQDRVDRANWQGQVNSNLLLNKNATQAIAQHAFYNDNSSPNSLKAICMVMRLKQICGNGVKDSNEQCDDGNTTNGDGCSSTCQTETPAPRCGDGKINQVSEQCDDGNNANGDGCNATCQIEIPSPLCGNGIKEGNEQCDDGNTVNGDGCNSFCQTETPKDDEPKDEEDCDASIGNLVWFDLNSNGKKDANEKGISGITLKMQKGDKIKHKITDKSGEYGFNNLCKGTYTVSVDTKDIPKGCYQVSDPDSKMDNTDKVELDKKEDYRKADFGYRCSTTPATGSGTTIALITAVIAGIVAIIIGKRKNVIAYFRK